MNAITQLCANLATVSLVLWATPAALFSQTGDSPGNDQQKKQVDEQGERQELAQALKSEVVDIVANRLFEKPETLESEREQNNHAMVVAALEEAIRVNSNDYAARLLLALFRDDTDGVELAAREWLVAEPSSIEVALVVFIIRDKQKPQADSEKERTGEATRGHATQKEWGELVAVIEHLDAMIGENDCESGIRFFCDRNDFASAIRFLTVFAKRHDADAMLVFRNFLSLRQLQQRRDVDFQPLADLYLECTEQVIATAIHSEAQVSEMTRSDIFGYLLAEYTAFLRHGRHFDRGLSFLAEQTEEVERMQFEPADADAFRRMIEETELVFLANSNRSAASSVALERLDRQGRRFDEGVADTAELVNAFADALLIVDKENLASVQERFESRGFFENDKLLELLQDKQDSETDLEWNRQSISAAWNAYLSRFVSDGRAAETGPNWQGLLSLEGTLVQFESEEPKHVLDEDPFGQIIRADLRFNYYISQFAATKSGKSLLDEFSFEKERWFNHQPMSAHDLSGKVVVVVMLTSDGFGTNNSAFFQDLMALNDTENNSRSALFAVFDDDAYEDRTASERFPSSNDDWFPNGRFAGNIDASGRAGIPETMKLPLVYAYQNKFVDALIPKTDFEYFVFHRVLIFDGRGMLRRVVCPGQEAFESIRDTVDRLVQETGSERNAELDGK